MADDVLELAGVVDAAPESVAVAVGKPVNNVLESVGVGVAGSVNHDVLEAEGVAVTDVVGLAAGEAVAEGDAVAVVVEVGAGRDPFRGSAGPADPWGGG